MKKIKKEDKKWRERKRRKGEGRKRRKKKVGKNSGQYYSNILKIFKFYFQFTLTSLNQTVENICSSFYTSSQPLVPTVLTWIVYYYYWERKTETEHSIHLPASHMPSKARTQFRSPRWIAGSQLIGHHCCILKSALAGSWNQEPELALTQVLWQGTCTI